ncbi:MAG: hypothetical protein ACLT76_01925 [Clostridium fessum]
MLSQQLVRGAGSQGRAAACELDAHAGDRNLIRDGKTPQMQSYLLSESAKRALLR